MPAVIQFCGCLNISNAVFGYFPKPTLVVERGKIESGNSGGFRTFDVEGFAIEVEIEFAKRAIESELLHQVAVFVRGITVGHKVPSCLDSEQS